MKSQNQIISEVVDTHLNQLIKNAYAKEAGIDIDDPDFWKKLNKWKEENTYEETYEREFCPLCGQEIE